MEGLLQEVELVINEIEDALSSGEDAAWELKEALRDTEGIKDEEHTLPAAEGALGDLVAANDEIIDFSS